MPQTTQFHQPLTLILGSSSKYRAQLLEKLQIPFRCVSPNIDETARPGETPHDLVSRLSHEKAMAVQAQLTSHIEQAPENCLIIGSDQVAVVNGDILGKPKDTETAKAQLRAASGTTVEFKTGLCLLHQRSSRSQHYVETTQVFFRTLNDAQIDRYIAQEQPLDCAGSIKSEGLGVCLIDRIEGRDPNTLVGLPLMGLVDLLLTQRGQIY